MITRYLPADGDGNIIVHGALCAMTFRLSLPLLIILCSFPLRSTTFRSPPIKAVKGSEGGRRSLREGRRKADLSGFYPLDREEADADRIGELLHRETRPLPYLADLVSHLDGLCLTGLGLATIDKPSEERLSLLNHFNLFFLKFKTRISKSLLPSPGAGGRARELTGQPPAAASRIA